MGDCARGGGCPFCAGKRPSRVRNLAVASPHLVREWHPARNGTFRPRDLTPRSSKRVWWRCSRGHEWSAAPKSRAIGQGCPFCSGNRVSPETSLAARAPALARQWHPTKNGDLRPRDVTTGANRSVWWKCPAGPDHEWRCKVSARGRLGSGCPFCAGQLVSITNSLATRFPKIARTWHPTKNGRLTPRDVTQGTTRRVWWKCPEGDDHEWQVKVVSRTRTGNGCPFCRGLRVSKTNSLARRFPKIAREWHPTKNGELTPHDVTRASNRHVWWGCTFGHVWRAMVGYRTSKGSGCPECYRVSRRRHVATTRKPRRAVHLPSYEGARRGQVRRVR